MRRTICEACGPRMLTGPGSWHGRSLDTVAPSNFPALNPEIIAATLASGGRNLTDGAAHFVQDMVKTLTQTHDPAPEGFQGRAGPGLHARHGGVPKRSVRTDPVCAADGEGAGRTDPDRAGLDHEILHPRPVAPQFDGQFSGGSGLHGLHDLVVQPDRRTGRPLAGGLPHGGGDGGAGRRGPASCPTARSMPSAIALAARCWRSRRRRWRATATTGSPASR